MLVLLIYALLVVTIGYGVSRTDDDWLIENWKERKGMKRSHFGSFMRSWCFVFALIMVAAFIICKWVSYDSYVTLRTRYDATIEQYAGAVEMYSDKAVIDVEKAAFTDFKYQGYQENIAGFVTGLRYEVVRYNKALIGKRLYKKSPFFSIFVVGPDDDMKILSLKTASTREIKED